MSETNIQTVQEYIEAMNRKQFDRIFELCSEDCVVRGEPFEGVGAMVNENCDEKIVLQTVLPNSSAAECLQTGDEVVRVFDATNSWDTLAELKSGTWNRGTAGTPVTINVRRDGKLLECHLTRDSIEGFSIKLSERLDAIKCRSKLWPVLNEKISLIFESDDLVAVYSTIHETHRDYHRSAVWSACCIYRLKNGKIIEMIGVAT